MVERGHRELRGGKGAQGQRKERKWGNPSVRSHSSASQGYLSQEGRPDGLSTLCRGTGAPGRWGPCPRGAYKLRRETEPVLKCGKSMEKDWPRIVRDQQKSKHLLREESGFILGRNSPGRRRKGPTRGMKLMKISGNVDLQEMQECELNEVVIGSLVLTGARHSGESRELERQIL